MLQIIDAKNYLANILGSLGEDEEAKQILEGILEFLKEHYKAEPHHVRIALAQRDLAVVYKHLQENKQAKELFETALPIIRKSYGDEHIELANTLTDLAELHIAEKQCTDAEALLREALLIENKWYSRTGNLALATMLTQVSLELSSDYHSSRKEHKDMKIHISISQCMPAAKTIASLASLSRKKNNASVKEKRLFKQAIFIIEQYYGFSHIKLVDLLMKLAKAYVSLADIGSMGFIQKYIPKDIFKSYDYLIKAVDCLERIERIFVENPDCLDNSVKLIYKEKLSKYRKLCINFYFWDYREKSIDGGKLLELSLELLHNKGNYELWSKRGDEYFNNMQLEWARRDYEEALSLEPGHFEAYANLLQCYHTGGSDEKKAIFFKQGSLHEPPIAQLFAEYAYFLNEQKESLECLEYCNQCLVLSEDDIFYPTRDPSFKFLPPFATLKNYKHPNQLSSFGLAFYLRVCAYLQLNQEQEMLQALQEFEKWMLTKDEANRQVWYFFLGDIYLQMKNSELVEQCIESSLLNKAHLKAEMCEYFYDIAKSYQKEGILATHEVAFYAITLAKKYVIFKPEHYRLIARYFHNWEMIEESEKYFREGLTQHPTTAILADFAHFLYTQEQYSDCLKRCSECLVLGEKKGFDDIVYEKSDWNSSCSSFKKLIEYKCNFWYAEIKKISAKGIALYLQVCCYLKDDDNQLEKRLQEFSCWVDGSNQGLWDYLLAETYEQAHKVSWASQYYERAHGKDSDFPVHNKYRYFESRAAFYIENKKVENAIAATVLAMSEAGNNAEYYCDIARRFHNLGQVDNATNCIKKAIELNLNRNMLVDYAHFLYQQKSYDECLEICQQYPSDIPKRQDEDYIQYNLTKINEFTIGVKKPIHYAPKVHMPKSRGLPFYDINERRYGNYTQYRIKELSEVAPVVRKLMVHAPEARISSEGLSLYLQTCCCLHMSSVRDYNEKLRKFKHFVKKATFAEEDLKGNCYFLLAGLYEQNGKLVAAQKYYNKAHQLNKNLPEILPSTSKEQIINLASTPTKKRLESPLPSISYKQKGSIFWVKLYVDELTSEENSKIQKIAQGECGIGSQAHYANQHKTTQSGDSVEIRKIAFTDRKGVKLFFQEIKKQLPSSPSSEASNQFTP